MNFKINHNVCSVIILKLLFVEADDSPLRMPPTHCATCPDLLYYCSSQWRPKPFVGMEAAVC
jgi:hypothetical protein